MDTAENLPSENVSDRNLREPQFWKEWRLHTTSTQDKGENSVYPSGDFCWSKPSPERLCVATGAGRRLDLHRYFQCPSPRTASWSLGWRPYRSSPLETQRGITVNILPVCTRAHSCSLPSLSVFLCWCKFYSNIILLTCFFFYLTPDLKIPKETHSL